MVNPQNNVLLTGPKIPAIPQIRLPNITLQNPIANLAVNNVAKPFVESMVNTPGNIMRGSNQIKQDFTTGDITHPKTLLADIGQVAMPSLNLAGLSSGGVAKTLVKPTLLQGIKQGAKIGAGFGGTYGLAQGLADNRDTTNPVKYLTDVFQKTGTGIATGGLLGGGLGTVGGTVGAVRAKLVDFLQSKHGLSPQAAETAVNNYTRDRLGKFTTPQKIRFTPGQKKTFADINKNLGRPTTEPVYYSDLDKLVKEEAPQPGLSIKTVDSQNGALPGGNVAKQPLQAAKQQQYSKSATTLPNDLGKVQEKQLNTQAPVTPSNDLSSTKSVTQQKTIGQLQQEHQNPDLTAYEQAFNAGDKATLDQLAAKYPGDARFQVHISSGSSTTGKIYSGSRVGVTDKELGKYIQDITKDPEYAKYLKINNGDQNRAIARVLEDRLSTKGKVPPDIMQSIYSKTPSVQDMETGQLLDPMQSFRGEHARRLMEDLGIDLPLNNPTDMNTNPLNQQDGNQGSMPLQNTPQIPIKLTGQVKNRPSSLPSDGLPPEQSGSALLPPQAPGSGSSSGKSIAQVPNSENPYFNTNKLNVSPEAKQQVNQVIQEVKPQIEKVVGKKLSNQEVINTANGSAKVLRRVVDRSQTEDFTARLLKTRQQLAAAADSGKVDQAYIDNLMAVKSHATDIARKLQSFSIGADPKTITSRDAILDAVLKVEKDSAKVVEAAKGVDFNDLKQATDFYRTFIKPTLSEKIDLIRYNSMLSSPNTHIVNATSNLINSAVVAPIEKTLTGTLDFLGSKMTGKQQTQFAGEGVQYAKGYAASLHDAAHAFANSLKGKMVTGNLDVRQIPLSTSKRISNLNLPTRLLEASDQFFTALTKGGETAALQYQKGKGVKVGNIETQALDNAKYRLFRSELHRDGQGTLLNSIDDFTGLVQKARSSDNPITSWIAKLTLPFVQTPMNILKQGVEYSPAGFATIPGAVNKTEQLSKAILGSSAAAATAMLVASGRSTWTEPTDPTKKAAYRAAGMQPYAVKIGDNWVSYAKLPPTLGFPIAFISALHDAEQNKTIDENQLNVILSSAAKFGNFFADQSYVKNIGDLVSAAKGSPEAMSRFVSNYPQQLIPYRALLGWMARIVDPYQRKVNTDANYLDQQVQQLFTQIPGLSMNVPARVDKSGEPIPNQNAGVNAFSPFRVTTERPAQKETYDLLQQKSLLNKNINAAEKMMQNGQTPDFSLLQASAAENKSDPKQQLQLKAQEDVAKAKVKLQGGTQAVGNKYFFNDNGDVKSIDLTPPTKGQGIDAFSNKDWQYTKARDVWKIKDQLGKDQANQAFKQLGVDPAAVRYDYLAHHSDDESAQYIMSKNLNHQELLHRVLTGRTVSVSGALFATNGVIDRLAEQGLLSKDESKYLKTIKLDTEGNNLTKSTGTGKGSRKAKALASLQSKNSLALSKLFQSQVKQGKPRNARNLDKLLKQRSPQNSGLTSIQSILAKSEATVKQNKKKVAIQTPLHA